MTDNEIIKALECCRYDVTHCKECPLRGSACIATKSGYALDLINRYKLELEQLTEKFNCQQTVYVDLSEIIKKQSEELKKAKAEATKEVTKKLLTYVKEQFETDNPYIERIMSALIEKVVKEMAGDG